MDMQALINSMNKVGEETRGKYQLTLSKAISIINGIAPNIIVEFDHNQLGPLGPHSYRGYYSDLAFDYSDKPITSGEFLLALNESLGTEFIGYKGGEFVMHENTPLWASNYGTTGRAMMDINLIEGKAIIKTADVD